MYVITADYRPNNPYKPRYYVFAENKRQAVKKFSSIISWLKVYSCEAVSKEEQDEIVANPHLHNIF